MNIILIEDDEYKIDLIINYLEETISNLNLYEAHSVKGATTLISNTDEADVVLLDMTLPTFDMSNGSSGGRPQGFGGIEILRYMEMIEFKVPVIIITQFQTFDTNKGTKDISYLKEILEKEDFENFTGIVQFSPSTESWKSELKILLGKI